MLGFAHDFERPLVLLQEKRLPPKDLLLNDDLAGIEDLTTHAVREGTTVLLGIRQNTMARDLALVTRFNKIIGGWELATADEKRKITDLTSGCRHQAPNCIPEMFGTSSRG